MVSNSGSMQSSSGGDEEHDSRAESISALLKNHPSDVGPIPNPPQPPPQPSPPAPHPHSSSVFDPLSSYFDPLSRSLSLTNQNSLLNLDMVWTKTLRSEPNCNDLNGFIASSTSSQPFISNNQGQSRGTFAMMEIAENATRGTVSGSATNDQTTPNNNNVVRNPKKRCRASRRAPTTVLTTDTTNFRAMVQEFTGIPAPPFTSSPFPRSRLNHFGAASTLRSASHLDPSPPPYLLRPFAQKVQPPPFVSPCSSSFSSFPSSSAVDAMPSTNTNNIIFGSASNTTNSTSINFQLPSDLGLLKQPQNLLSMNMQYPILNFQSHLQAPPKYPLANSVNLCSKPQGSSEIAPNDYHLKMGVLEEFGLSHGHVNDSSDHISGLSNIVSSDTTLSRNENNPLSWGGGVGSDDRDQGLFRSLKSNYSNSRRVTNGNLNYSASSSNFHGDKGPENVATRCEGMVESWICSSD